MNYSFDFRVKWILFPDVNCSKLGIEPIYKQSYQQVYQHKLSTGWRVFLIIANLFQEMWVLPCSLQLRFGIYH